MSKTKLERIEELNERIEQIKNRQRELKQQHKRQERKNRTKRLCQRMGLFESMLPETITLTDEHFKSFLEKTILSKSASKLLSALLTEQNTTAAAPIRVSAAAQGNATPANKTPYTTQHNGEDEGEDGARATG